MLVTCDDWWKLPNRITSEGMDLYPYWMDPEIEIEYEALIVWRFDKKTSFRIDVKDKVTGFLRVRPNFMESIIELLGKIPCL